jgi:hypothetical protein
MISINNLCFCYIHIGIILLNGLMSLRTMNMKVTLLAVFRRKMYQSSEKFYTNTASHLYKSFSKFRNYAFYLPTSALSKVPETS